MNHFPSYNYILILTEIEKKIFWHDNKESNGFCVRKQRSCYCFTFEVKFIFRYRERRINREVGGFGMSVTVRDCLELPSLRSGRVVAGEKGLDSIVASISVLEFDDYEDNFYIPNEMTITSFYCAKDDVDEQCRIIRHCKKSGDVGLILFYSDIILKRIDERLIETANACNFPVIVLRGDDMGLVYSDVIADVMEAVITDKQSEKSHKNSCKGESRWGKDLISAVIDEKAPVSGESARNLLMSASEFDCMIVMTCRDSKKHLTTEHHARVKKYLESSGIPNVADVQNGEIVIMAKNPDFSQYSGKNARRSLRRHDCKMWEYDHIKKIGDICGCENDIVFFIFANVADIEDYGHNYRLMRKIRSEVMTIFPHREMISSSHMRFARRCARLLEDEQNEEAELLLKIMDPLASDKDFELAETLAAYLLDADFEVKRAAELTYMHRNTILYRIRKANALFNEDIHRSPFRNELYLAVALRRLKDARAKEMNR